MVRNHAERKWKGSKFRNIKQSSINEKKKILSSLIGD